jgi:nitrogen fixation protein NifB
MEKRLPASIAYPCFSSQALQNDGLLLHLATGCNTYCKYCFKERDRPGMVGGEGTGETFMTPDTAVSLLAHHLEGDKAPAMVEIGGPGEPLLNAATYVLLRRIMSLYPHLTLSVWTNGVLLPDRLEELVRSGMKNMTLSINAAVAETAGKIYEWVIYRGRKYTGGEAANLILQQQWNGLENAVEAGVAVTVYIADITDVNRQEIDLISDRARKIGAERISVVTLNP